MTPFWDGFALGFRANKCAAAGSGRTDRTACVIYPDCTCRAGCPHPAAPLACVGLQRRIGAFFACCVKDAGTAGDFVFCFGGKNGARPPRAKRLVGVRLAYLLQGRHGGAFALHGQGGATRGKAQIRREPALRQSGKRVRRHAVARQLIEERADERVRSEERRVGKECSA